MDKKRKQSASGGGLYAAIAVCLLAVGVGSWQIFQRSAVRTADHVNAVSGSAAVSDSRTQGQTAQGSHAAAANQAATADQDGMEDQAGMAKAPDLEAGAVPTPTQAAAPAQTASSSTGGSASAASSHAGASSGTGGTSSPAKSADTAASSLSAKEDGAKTVSGNAVIPADSPQSGSAAQTETAETSDAGTSGDPSADGSGAQTAVSMTPPLEGEAVTAFSMAQLIYNETLRDWRTHDGIDITAEEGTGVCAALDGTVASVTADPLMGTTVVIRHEGERETLYACLNGNVEIEAGDDVSAGQLIGFVGQGTGAEAALGPHLHFSVLENGEAVDPSAYLP